MLVGNSDDDKDENAVSVCPGRGESVANFAKSWQNSTILLSNPNIGLKRSQYMVC